MREAAPRIALIAALAALAAMAAHGAPDDAALRLRAQRDELEAGLRLHAAQLRLLEYRGRDVSDFRTAGVEAEAAVSNLGERIRSGDIVAAIAEARVLAARLDRMLADADAPVSQLSSASAWRIQLAAVAAVLQATVGLAERRLATLALLGGNIRPAERSAREARARITRIFDAVNRDDPAAANAALAEFAEITARLRREIDAATP